MKNNFTIRLKRLTLCTALSACTLSPCLAQTARPLNLGQDGMLTDSMLRLQTPRYQVISAKDDIRLHWTGKTFRPPKSCEGDKHLVTSSLEKVDNKLFSHPLSITIKDIEVSKNDGEQVPMTILAVKSAEKDIARIARYCQKDVLATARLYQRLNNIPTVEDGCVFFVE